MCRGADWTDYKDKFTRLEDLARIKLGFSAKLHKSLLVWFCVIRRSCYFGCCIIIMRVVTGFDPLSCFCNMSPGLRQLRKVVLCNPSMAICFVFVFGRKGGRGAGGGWFGRIQPSIHRTQLFKG